MKAYLHAEQVLHNKGEWREGAFDTPLDSRFWPENRPKFGLPYFLIPTHATRSYLSDEISNNTSETVWVREGNAKYIRLFVHPESLEHYGSLVGRYKFVDGIDSEFIASPTASFRSLLTWRKDGNGDPFIAKVSLDTTIIGSINRTLSEKEIKRSLGTQNALSYMGSDELGKMGVGYFPETFGIVPILSNGEALGGMLIRELPPELIQGQTEIFSLSAIMSRELSPNTETKISKLIKSSGLSPYDFLKQIFVDEYLAMYEELSLKRGFNFEPHSQNLSMEFIDGQFTGRWIHRDFGGFWVDLIRVMESGGPHWVFQKFRSAETFYFRGGRSNYLDSAVNFYKRQVLHKLGRVVKESHRDFKNQDLNNLLTEFDRKLLNLWRSHLNVSIDSVPSYTDYKKSRQLFLDSVDFSNEEDYVEVEDNTQKQFFKYLVREKIRNDEWVIFKKLNDCSKCKYYYNEDGIFMVHEGKIIGYGVFNPEELRNLNTKGFDLMSLKRADCIFEILLLAG